MAYSTQQIGVTDASATTYTVTVNCLKLSHLRVYYAGLLADFTEQTDFTMTGTPGNATLTLGGSFGPVDLHGTIRVERDTTLAANVDFQDAATLRESDLDNLFLQNLYLSQEAIDKSADTIVRNAARTKWDASYLVIENLGTPVNANDAARLVDVQNVSISSGNLPAVTVANNSQMLAVNAGSWAVRTTSEIKSSLSCGTAADLDFGTGNDDLGKKSVLDTTYLKAASNLTDVGNLTTTRTTLGIQNLAGLSPGTTADDLVQLNASAQYPSNDGSLIDLSGHAVNSGRLENVAFISIPTQTPNYGATPQPLITFTLTHLVGSSSGCSLNSPASGFALAPGKWEVQINVNVKSTVGGSSGTLVWGVYDITNTATTYQSDTKTLEFPTVFSKYLVLDLTAATGDTQYNISMAETTASSAVPLQFTEGDVILRRYS